jgi:RNA polymerase sigma-70 factor (ECF subfamily)
MSESLLLEVEQNYHVDDDAKLVAAAQENPAEFKLLYQKWLKPVYRYFYFRVSNVKDAEDLTSQVFLRAYQDLPRYHNRGCFSAWLFSIARARAVDYYRKGNKEIPLDNITDAAGSLDLLTQAVHSAEIEQVTRLIATLSKEEQELIRLRFMAELSYREIGAVLNRKEDAVRKSLSRLLDRMQSQLEVNYE